MIQTIKDLVSAKADTTVALAKEIWGYAETSPPPLPPPINAAAASRWWAFWRSTTPCPA